MTRTRLFLSGLLATLSLSAAPVFADDTAKAEARIELKAGKGPIQTLHTQEQPSFNDKLGNFDERFETKFRGEEAPRYDQKLERKVLDLVNDVRVRQGLSELRLDSRGTAAAREASVEASREGNFNHLNSSVEARLRNQGISAGYEMTEATRLLKENDLDKAAKKVVQAWMKDKRQARLLLDKNLTYVGVGAVTANGKSAVTLDAFGPKPVLQPRPPVSQKPPVSCN